MDEVFKAVMGDPNMPEWMRPFAFTFMSMSTTVDQARGTTDALQRASKAVSEMSVAKRTRQAAAAVLRAYLKRELEIISEIA